MENIKDTEDATPKSFVVKYNKQDVSKTPEFKLWVENLHGAKYYKCPNCWSYETDISGNTAICDKCKEEFCVKCNKVVTVHDIGKHYHEGCMKTLCGCCEFIIEYGQEEKMTASEYCKTFFSLLFGLNMTVTYKYFRYYLEGRQKDGVICCCCKYFVALLNLFANVCYCVYTEVLFICLMTLFLLPSLFIPSYFKVVLVNWLEGLENLTVDTMPILDWTVSGFGYEW